METNLSIRQLFQNDKHLHHYLSIMENMQTGCFLNYLQIIINKHEYFQNKLVLQDRLNKYLAVLDVKLVDFHLVK